MLQQIRITVDTTGKTQVETRGFAGESCRDASKFIEQALGRAAGERFTPEYYATADQQQTAQQ